MGLNEFCIANSNLIVAIYAALFMVLAFITHKRIRTMYVLSRHRGILNLSRAFFFFCIGFVLLLVLKIHCIFILDCQKTLLGIILTFFTYGFHTLGTLYMAYSFIRRRFKEVAISCHCLGEKRAIVIIAATLVAFFQMLAHIVYQQKESYIFFGVQLILLIIALSLGRKKKKIKFDAQHLTLLVSLVIFIVFFLGEIITVFIPSAELFTWGVAMLLFIKLTYKVIKLTK